MAVMRKKKVAMRKEMLESEKERGLGVPFQRIRRITGYLVGTLDTWNSAKRAEEKDRVKHIKT